MASAISSEVPVTPQPTDSLPKLTAAWGAAPKHDYSLTVSLDDVMNEQLSLDQGPDVGQASGGCEQIPDTDTTSDEMLARLLQYEFDEEFTNTSNQNVQPDVAFKKTDTVDVGFDPFRQLKTDADSDEDDDNRQWDTFAAGTKFTVGKQGFAKSKGPQSKVLSTKHDAAVCGRRNACRVMVRVCVISAQNFFCDCCLFCRNSGRIWRLGMAADST